MPISHKHKIIFVHIPKTAGTTIEDMLDLKIWDENILRSEKNIRALATFRGSTCGFEYAESFILLKEIN